MRRTIAAAAALAALVPSHVTPVDAQQPSMVAIRPSTLEQLRAWDARVTQGERAGNFRLRRADVDPAVPTRRVERLQQFHGGVRVWGAEVVRDADRGVPVSMFGSIAPDLRLDIVPALGPVAARQRLLELGGSGAVLLRPVELVILPLGPDGYRLAYMSVVAAGLEVVRLFVDAQSGAELRRYSEIQTQSAVGTGQGVFGGRKKLSVVNEAGAYFADDRLRPPVLRTFDMRGNFGRALDALFGAPLAPAERAQDSDNDWADPSAVDAHVHVGWTYDYFFERHGRRGLDGQDRPITSLINGLTPQEALTAPPDVLFTFVANAFWCGACGAGGAGMMFFGNGIPPDLFFVATGQNVAPVAGSLDVAAHELSHGVTDSSSRLIYEGESGALNEAFSDIMATGTEFFFQEAGAGRGQADYLIAEDTFVGVRPGARNGIRSLADPALFGQPDHYSRRFTGSEDNGGVHINSGIANHAFYLAIEGGTNRTSGLTVQGVGASNREQIERVFYRAFVFLLPPNAAFATARAATIQAARDLYGAGSAPERAVAQAWDAVGVQ